MQVPRVEIDLQAFWDDPYPVLEQMRRQTPIGYVPQLDATLITKRDDIFVCEKNVAVFSSEQPGGLMTRLMGENMMRKDGAAHIQERQQMQPSVSPAAVKKVWTTQFRMSTDQVLNELETRGADVVDLVTDYALPVSLHKWMPCLKA